MKIVYTDKELKKAQLALKMYLSSCPNFTKDDLSHLMEHNLMMVLTVVHALGGREEDDDRR